MTHRPWPGNAPFALCLTHDVDHLGRYLYQRLWRVYKEGLPALQREWNDFSKTFWQRYSAWNFDALMDVEARYGARSTFLFMQESARGFGPKYWGRYTLRTPKVTSLLRRLHEGGWEVGLHGSLLSWVNRDLFDEEKVLLEALLGAPVVSTRQHYLLYDANMTPHIHAQCGMRIDSTYGYAHKPYDGKYGHMPFLLAPHALVEAPITVMDTVGLENADVRKQSMNTVRNIAAKGGLITLDWHQCAYNTRIYPARVDFYDAVLRFGADNGAWFATLRDVAQHMLGEGGRNEH